MTKTIYASFDGEVFIPDEDIELKPNKRYLIQIILEPKSRRKNKTRVLQRISARARDLGVKDLAAQHDHYLYGIDKR